MPPTKSSPSKSTAEPKKKQRKFNQLGLTPRKEEYETSDEDDADEESKLATAALQSGGNGYAQLISTWLGRAVDSLLGYTSSTEAS